jgi:hypothetical protein
MTCKRALNDWPRIRRVQQAYCLPVILAICAVCLSPNAEAARKSNKRYNLEITPFVGYRFFGSFDDEDTEEDYDLESSSSAGVIVNFPSKNNTEWEIYYSKQSTEIKTGDLFQSVKVLDMDVEYLMIGGTYLFEREKEFQPYFVATIGAARFEPSGANTSSDTFFAFSAGGGWKYFPDKRIGLRLDGRFIGSLIDSDSDIFCQTGPEGNGCVIRNDGDVLWQFELQAGIVFRF